MTVELGFNTRIVRFVEKDLGSTLDRSGADAESPAKKFEGPEMAAPQKETISCVNRRQ